MLTKDELVYQPWKKAIAWDVTHKRALEMVEEKTFAFDPRLSYETTGYRPINETDGLDFDPAPFRATGQRRVDTGRYTDLYPNSKTHVKWWNEQQEMSENGVEFNHYRITGDHYFFLNFYTMLVVDGNKRAGAAREEAHPLFWVVHYEWFHYVELAEILGYDCAGLKSRGVGFSEIAASLGVRMYTTRPKSSCLYVAAYEPFLIGKGVLQKCWNQLDWLNQNTEGGMRRVRMGENSNMLKKAIKKNKQGEESGHGAILSGQTVDKPDKLRGDRTERVFFEESGSNPCLLGTYGVAQALVIINGERLGTRILFGTGGDTAVIDGKRGSVSGLHGLEKIFLSPRSYFVLPYIHNYNTLGDYVETGYFLPAWRTVKKAMDHRGFADPIKGKKYYQSQRDDLKDDSESYLKHCAEYCWTYEEALSRKGSNRFNQELLANQRMEIEVHKRTILPERGFMEWTHVDGKKTNPINGVRFIPHRDGNVEVVERPPEQTIANLYVGGIDSIDVGSDESIVGDKGSKFCIVIKKRHDGMSGGQYVCKYLNRSGDVRKDYETAMMILTWYNCQANLEATRVNIIGYFRDRGKIGLLMRRPKYALQGQSGNVSATNLYGTQATKHLIEYGINLIVDYILDYSESMMFLDMIIELQNYSDEMKGKYDIVAAMQMCEIGDQEMMGIIPKKIEEEHYDDVGFYIDSRGYRRWGVIEKQ